MLYRSYDIYSSEKSVCGPHYFCISKQSAFLNRLSYLGLPRGGHSMTGCRSARRGDRSGAGGCAGPGCWRVRWRGCGNTNSPILSPNKKTNSRKLFESLDGNFIFHLLFSKAFIFLSSILALKPSSDLLAYGL